MWQNLFHFQTHYSVLICVKENAIVATPFLLCRSKIKIIFVANIRYIVHDCSSSIGQRCAGSIFAIPNIGHHSAIVPLLALYRRSFCHSILYLYSIVLLWFHATIVLAHSSLLRLNLSLMIGIAFLGYLSDNLADLPTAHCRLYTLSVVIPHLWVLSFTQRSLIPRIFSFRLKPLVATFHSCTCRHFSVAFYLDATPLNTSATLTFCADFDTLLRAVAI